MACSFLQGLWILESERAFVDSPGAHSCRSFPLSEVLLPVIFLSPNSAHRASPLALEHHPKTNSETPPGICSLPL